MPRRTTRIPDELADRMADADEIDWSETICRSVRRRLGNPGSSPIQKLVADYRDDINRLWALHMLSHSISTQHVCETMELIFGSDQSDIVDAVETELANRDIDGMYSRTADGYRVGDTIRGAIACNGLADLKSYTKTQIQDAQLEIRKGLFVLSLFLWNRLDGEGATIHPKGVERTWQTYADDTEVEFEELIARGIAYKKYHDANAYKHWNHLIPEYSLSILNACIDRTSSISFPGTYPGKSTLRELYADDACREVIEWTGGTFASHRAHSEEEYIQNTINEQDISLTVEEFKTARDQLIQNGVLVLDYDPRRRSAGSRSSQPAKWQYRLTPPARNALPKVLLESNT